YPVDVRAGTREHYALVRPRYGARKAADLRLQLIDPDHRMEAMRTVVAPLAGETQVRPANIAKPVTGVAHHIAQAVHAGSITAAGVAAWQLGHDHAALAGDHAGNGPVHEGRDRKSVV